MAAIDFIGNVVRVTAAGTLNAHVTIDIASTVIWSANTTASLIVGMATTGGAEVFRYATNINVPNSAVAGFTGRHDNLSFNTVTACTAYLILR